MELAAKGAHLHRFHVYGADYGADGRPAAEASLGSFGLRARERFVYEYDFFAP